MSPKCRSHQNSYVKKSNSNNNSSGNGRYKHTDEYDLAFAYICKPDYTAYDIGCMIS